MPDTQMIEQKPSEEPSVKWASEEKLKLVTPDYRQALAGIDVIITDATETENGFPEAILVHPPTKREIKIMGLT